MSAFFELVVSALILGLTGGFHCLFMCGPLVAALTPKSSPSRWWSFPISYSLGRLLGYGTMGFIIGLLGAVVDKYSLLSGLPKLSAFVGGPLMVLAGLSSLTPLPWRQRLLARLSWLSSVKQAGSKLYRSVLGSSGQSAAWALGLLTPFIPCGLLYAVYGKAVSTGHPLSGALFMIMFALASSPALILVSKLSSWTKMSAGKLQKLAAIALILLGLKVCYDAFPINKEEPVPCEHCADPAIEKNGH
ncbi:MAG: sulfite exporter TauE/SafE family protein [Planctomycetota bacterium]|nr:sulfite exporter TauE/SafE family protein [Planctomycetota bacterium]